MQLIFKSHGGGHLLVEFLDKELQRKGGNTKKITLLVGVTERYILQGGRNNGTLQKEESRLREALSIEVQDLAGRLWRASKPCLPDLHR